MADARAPHAAGEGGNREDVATPSRFARLGPAALGAAVFAVELLLYRPLPLGVVQDDGLYAILGQALATGRGYRFLNLPGAPAAAHYPPGFPALLAVLSHLLPAMTASVRPYMAVNLGLLGVAAACLYMLARRLGMGPRTAGATALAGFLMPPALAMGTALFSEPLWLACAVPWLVWAHAAAQRDEARAREAFALGLAAGAIALVRVQAVALVVGLLVVLVLRRRRRAAALAALGAAVALVPWQLWAAAHAGDVPTFLAGKYGAYGPWLVAGLRARGWHLVAGTIAHNVGRIAFVVGGMFAPPRISSGASWLLVVPLATGGARLWRRAPVVFWALVVHAAIIVVWPFEPQRFVWGSWPFLALWLGVGCAAIGEWMRRRRTDASTARTPATLAGTWLAAAAGAWLAFGALSTTAVLVAGGAFRNIATGGARRLEPAVQWVAQHAPAGAVVASDDETAVYLYTGHPAVPTSSYTAAGYAAAASGAPPVTVLDSVVARYRPDFVIAYWNSSIEAAQRLAAGPSPALTHVEDMAGGSVFARAPAAGK